MKTVLYIAWVATFTLGSLSLGVFTAGLVRDHRVGEPDIPLQLSATSDWQSQRFRVLTSGTYKLGLSSVNHQPPFNVPFDGVLEVDVQDPAGRSVHQARYTGRRIGHVRPDNYAWSTLESLALDPGRVKPWTLRVRVVEADPNFAQVTSTLHLRRDREDPGMGGLINYVMLFPAIVLLLVSMALGTVIAVRGGTRVALVLSLVAFGALAATNLIH